MLLLIIEIRKPFTRNCQQNLKKAGVEIELDDLLKFYK